MIQCDPESPEQQPDKLRDKDNSGLSSVKSVPTTIEGQKMLGDIKANLRANIQGGETGPPKEIKIEFMSKEEKLRQERMMAKFK